MSSTLEDLFSFLVLCYSGSAIRKEKKERKSFQSKWERDLQQESSGYAANHSFVMETVVIATAVVYFLARLQRALQLQNVTTH